LVITYSQPQLFLKLTLDRLGRGLPDFHLPTGKHPRIAFLVALKQDPNNAVLSL